MKFRSQAGAQATPRMEAPPNRPASPNEERVHMTRSRTMQAPVDTRDQLHEVSISLVQSVYPVSIGIRLIGVSISKFHATSISKQLNSVCFDPPAKMTGAFRASDTMVESRSQVTPQITLPPPELTTPVADTGSATIRGSAALRRAALITTQSSASRRVPTVSSETWIVRDRHSLRYHASSYSFPQVAGSEFNGFR